MAIVTHSKGPRADGAANLASAGRSCHCCPAFPDAPNTHEASSLKREGSAMEGRHAVVVDVRLP
eukprot:2579237-Lingulodinium_polyedra.AAC.3